LRYFGKTTVETHRHQDRLATRRLTAVAFADVADFSALMAQDELWTTEQWNILKESVLSPLMVKYEGRLVGTAGDAVLLEFKSVVAALIWAIEVQKLVRNAENTSKQKALELRISVNVDDVLVNEDDILGDGVNIAARIHASAEPGQVVVTSLVRELVGNRIAARFIDLGTPRLKNIKRIIHVYRVEPRMDAPEENATFHQPAIEWASRPSVAILPFRSASGHEMEDYFGSGITEDIITGISHSHACHVIARASTLRFANRAIDLKEIAAQLNVEYLIYGSVRRWGDRLRITAEMVDIAVDRTIWAEKFDGDVSDLFDFQDSIVSSVVGSFEPRLKALGIERVRNRSTDSLDAYYCVLKAASELYRFTDESYVLSGIALRRALELDPSFARAHAYAAWRLNYIVGEGRSDDPEADKELAIEHARQAVALDPEDAFCQVAAGHLTSFVDGNPHLAMEMFDQALSLDQNNALGWATSGVTLAYLGRGVEAMQRFQNAFKLSPYDPLHFTWWTGCGIASFVSGNYEEAVKWLRKAQQANPRFVATLRILTASLAMNGNEAAAQEAGKLLLSFDKDFSVDRFVSWYPFVRREDLLSLKKGLLLAGLPP